ncbi:hypothetical protein [Cytobacillus oceanisediminis]|uniref:hypothetical protein n=1 Tax=Cytobacillus oceanisediminis TaxID=665099 RepID=UPI001FB2E98F|nr:hypothetical protein [Cytobacillus oceanisediminis]UOE58005.1 hypothetical protein IRB79_27450 [Cytobacillus oceanisediminis]
MSKGPGFYSHAPLYLFDRHKGLNWENMRMLLVYFKAYALDGAKGFIDEDGNKTSHKFDEVRIEDTFLLPTAILMLWEKKEVNIEHVHAFAYLSYLAHVQKSHIVKINKNLVKDATGLSKTRFQEVVQELIYDELSLVSATNKNNQVEIPWLEPGQIKLMNEAEQDLKSKQDELDESNSVAIPSYFLQDHKELGFSYREMGLIVTFASGLSREEPRTFNEAVQFVIDHTNKDEGPDSFQVIAAIRKAEKKGIFDLIKGREGHISISWKGVEV